MKPTIAYVIDSLGRGGAERVAVNLANAIDPERYRVLMITTRRAGEFASDLDPRVEQVHLNRTGRFDLSAVRRLAAIFDERKVDLVHSHNHSSSYLCRVVRAMSRGKWAHVVHDHHGPVVGSKKLALLDRVLLSNVDFYIAVSEILRERAVTTIGIHSNYTCLVANGVPISATANRLQIHPLTIIQAARVVPVKHLELAIETARHLKDAGYAFRWLSAGQISDVVLVDHLKRLVAHYGLEESFIFFGERADLPELLGQAHIGVLTSRHEGMSMAMLEYMASGLPVVMTDVGESSELLKRAGGGMVVVQNDAMTFANSIMTLLDSDQQRDDYGKKNRDFVISQYSDRAMAEKIMSIYDKVLSHVS